MTETAETSTQAEAASVKLPQTGEELRQILTSKGVSQTELLAQVRGRGIKMSQTTMHRIMANKRRPKEAELNAIHEILGVAPHDPEPPSLPGSGGGGSREQEPPRKRWAAVRGFPGRHPIASIVLALAVGGAVVAAVFLLFLRGTDNDGSTPSPGGTDQSGGGQVASCDQYEIGARDLWLRDQYGATQIELPHGQKVTVTHRASPYWEVTTDSGQDGWVDPNYLKPLC